MPKPSISDRTSPNSINGDPAVKTALETAGGWLFKHRTSLPLPIAAAILLIPPQPIAYAATWSVIGVALTVAGEALRLWAVHHIGVISRTRSDRLGPLIDGGPFGAVRNPLYIGNIALWVGFALTARMIWLAPITLILLGAEYHAIVRWEESLLEARLGDEYREYCRRVGRWIPSLHGRQSTVDNQRSTWRETLFSERGTLIAIAAGYLLLWLKLKS